jgi:hypothetical protein
VIDTKGSGSWNEHRAGQLQQTGGPHNSSRIPLRSTLLCVCVCVCVCVYTHTHTYICIYVYKGKGKGKGKVTSKVLPATGREGPDGE